MTKPGTMRWKIVPSKNPESASETSDAVACGDVRGASRTANEPQLVRNVSVQRLAASSRRAGAVSFAGERGFGVATCAHDPGGGLVEDEPPPQPVAASAAASVTTATALCPRTISQLGAGRHREHVGE